MARFTTLDAIVLSAYPAGTLPLGLYVGRRQKDAKDYFVADRAIPWWAVMFSIVASETSALTFISTPGLSYGNAPGFGDLGFLQIVGGYIIGRFVVAGVLLPRYFQGNLVTAYALLETRFGLATRRFTRREDESPRLLSGAGPTTHDLGRAHRRRVPRHGVARHRPAHRAAAHVVAIAEGRATRDHRLGLRGVLPVLPLPLDRPRALGVLSRPEVSRHRPDLPDVHPRAHATRARGA